MDRVALPFCSITLTAVKPTKLPTILNTVGDHIKKRRLELGLYQKQVAKIIGVDESTVTNWEKNRTNPTLKCMPKVMEFLGYDPSAGQTSSLGVELVRYRGSRGMTQKELAKRIGMNPTTLTRIERGEGKCSPSILKKVLAFLK